MGLNSFIGNWFMMPSQKKEKEAYYYNKMLPFGDAQKKWEDNTIETIFSDNKDKIPTIKYMCYIRREMLIDNTINDESSLKSYNKLAKRMRLSQEDSKFVEAFAKLEYDVKSADDFPSIQSVIEQCM